MGERPSWDDYFMDIAKRVSTRSTCLRRQIGAVAVKERHILCTGYNGPGSGITHCVDRGGCLRDKLKIPSGEQQQKCYAIHAEQNLIVQAAYHGISLKGATIYCTEQPCIICMKMLIGIKPEKLVYENPYPDKDTVDLLKEVARERLFKPYEGYKSWNFFNWEK